MATDRDDENQLYAPVLDAVQLVRIEATHRGFGYQHLFAVACLLDMEASKTDLAIIEHDEDVELVRKDSHIYIQVKTRNRPIQFADLESALDRFAGLRAEHSQGRRARTAQFALVCNAEPGPDLRKRLAESSWPADVAFLSPGRPMVAQGLLVPTPWPDLGVALQSCEAKAAQVPFASLAPSTLVLKLAGLVQYLATGHGGHAVSRGQVSEFFERLVIQLHDFPQPPADYRPQAGEPGLDDVNRVRLVVGVSGAGKTVWASHAALLNPLPAVYFDIGELPGSALASSLARELAARFLMGGEGSGAALPTASGLELLGLVSRRITEVGREVIVVLDNIHRVSAVALYQVLSAAAEIRFVMLGQAWVGQAELEARLEIQAETLGGWALDDVAAVFAAAGCPIDAATGRRIRQMTGGVPLYVKNSTQLTVDTYSGDVSAFVRTVTQRLNVVGTAQEVILAEAFGQLSPQARTAAALLDLAADVPLKREEALELLAADGGTAASNASALRELARSGVVQLSYTDSLKLHDAFRLLARDARAELPQATVSAARETLVGLLERSLPLMWPSGRFGLFVRLLPQTDRVSTLISLATYEQFHQTDDPQELKAILESAAQAQELSEEDRFWALDALTYWEYNEGVYGRIEALVAQMARLADGSDLDAGALAELSMKQMIIAALTNNRESIDSAYESGLQRIAGDPAKLKILQYNRALALYQIEAYEEAWTLAFNLLMEYYDDLNLDFNDVFLANAEHIHATAPDIAERDDLLRHSGDCLDLMAKCHNRLGRPAGMAYLHAMKFYNAAGAWRSAVRAGQDAADELAEIGDFDAARKVCEDFLLPAVTTFQLSDLLVPVRAQYAVILAWCGDFDSARDEMTRLEAYRVSEIGAAELANQRALIERITATRRGLADDT